MVRAGAYIGVKAGLFAKWFVPARFRSQFVASGGRLLRPALPDDGASEHLVLVSHLATNPTSEATQKAQPELSCAVCGAELVYAGSGRKPTRCAEHKRTRVKK